jgi:hypothetical protein
VTEEGYTWSEHKSSYGGIEQRWLVVESNFRRDSDLGKLEKNSKKLKLKLRINCKNSPKLNLLVPPTLPQQLIAYPNN